MFSYNRDLVIKDYVWFAFLIVQSVSYMLRYMRKYRVAVWKFRSVYIDLCVKARIWNFNIYCNIYCVINILNTLVAI